MPDTVPQDAVMLTRSDYNKLLFELDSSKNMLARTHNLLQTTVGELASMEDLLRQSRERIAQKAEQ